MSKITVASESNAPALSDRAGQIACFRENSYVVLPGVLSAAQVQALNAAIDRDRKANPFLWWFKGSPNNGSNLLLTEPAFDLAPRPPGCAGIAERT